MSAENPELFTRTRAEEPTADQGPSRIEEAADAAQGPDDEGGQTAVSADLYNQRDEWTGPFYEGGAVSFFE